MKKVVTFAGGTGSFVLLSALKMLDEIDITAIVPSTDSGGSSGKLRDLYGFLPPGDIRQCLVALAQDSENTEYLRKLFSYRFEVNDGINGHNFGNLFLTALSDITKDQEKAIEVAGKILNIKGNILPVTLENGEIIATYENGSKIIGEHWIDEPKFPHDGRLRITNLESSNGYTATEKTIKAILAAEYIIIAPGDLYTSIFPILIAKGVREALSKSKCKIIYFVNLFTKFGQTYNFTASDFVVETEKYLGRKVDKIIINSAIVPEVYIEMYAKSSQILVDDNLGADSRVNRVDIISELTYNKGTSDKIFRSIVRHDPLKIESLLRKLL